MPVETSDEEELYFAELDQERRRKLRDKLSGAAASLEEQQKIASTAGTENLGVAEKIKALGFDGETAAVFDLVPLVHVAWADGTVQRGERAAILKVVTKRGIDKGSEAYTTIESLLEERPSDSWMRQSLAVLRELTGGINDRTANIVDLCIDVAAASGGFLGLGLGKKIGDEEKVLIDEIVGALGDGASKLRDELAEN